MIFFWTGNRRECSRTLRGYSPRGNSRENLFSPFSRCFLAKFEVDSVATLSPPAGKREERSLASSFLVSLALSLSLPLVASQSVDPVRPASSSSSSSSSGKRQGLPPGETTFLSSLSFSLSLSLSPPFLSGYSPRLRRPRFALLLESAPFLPSFLPSFLSAPSAPLLSLPT